MSKYKVGDKFVIEIGYGIADPLYGARYFVKGFNTIVFDDGGLDLLERYDADEKANADYNAGYEDGLRDAWECARKLVLLKTDGGIPSNDYEEVFGTNENEYIIFKEMPVSEVLSNLKEYEAKQKEIQIGDEVIDNNGIKFVVTRILSDSAVHVFNCVGTTYTRWKGNLTKTGRHYDIDCILEQLKGTDDE